MDILFTICARAGSKGVKSKNSRRFLGAPLIYYTLSVYEMFCVQYADYYHRIDLALNTDSDQVLEQCRNTGIRFEYIRREDRLGGDKVAKADVIADTLLKMEAKTGNHYDVVLDLDLTSPLRTVEDVAGCLNQLSGNPEMTVVYSVTNARRLPYFNMVLLNQGGYAERVIKGKYLTRQEAPQCFDMNASIYAYRREPLLENKQNSIFDGNAGIWMMRDTAVLDIDSEEDFELMQVVAQYFFDHYEEFGRVRDNLKKFVMVDE